MNIVQHYSYLVSSGEVERDRSQEAAARRLAVLDARLSERDLASKSSALGWMFGKRERDQAPPKGLYIHGDVGRGKTMLLDLFFRTAGVRRKRRTHFHEFMNDVHERVHSFRQKQREGNGVADDAIAVTAAEIAAETELLCFDEFHVTDIADAMILGRLFTRLFAAGIVLVTTSNIAPDDLYKDGLNRASFLPFIDLLKQHVDVLRLEARTDFRLEKLGQSAVWHVPADARADAALDGIWKQLTAGQRGSEDVLALKGRSLVVPKAAMGVARFSFAQLCQQPRAAADYLKLTFEYHTLIVDHIPVMDQARRNEAKRFILLIDTLYDNSVKLVASAAAEPDNLYTARDGIEAQEFRRTASRLIEMRSRDYLARPRGRGSDALSTLTKGIIET